MKNFDLNTQNGRSMIEMLGVLAIIGVLSIGGIAGYSKAMQKYRINKTIEQITLIAGNVRTFFAPQRSYEGLDNRDVVKKAKLVPEEMWVYGTGSSTGRLVGFETAFGTTLDFYVYSLETFYIVLHNIPQEACIELAGMDWTNSNVISIEVGRNAGDHAYLHRSNKNGCTGAYDESTIIACLNGTNIAIPAPIDKVSNVCSDDGSLIAFEFK